MTVERSSSSGPLIRELLRFSAAALGAFGTAQSEAMAPTLSPSAAAVAISAGATIPVAPSTQDQLYGVVMQNRGAVVGLRVQQRIAGGGAVGETVTYVVQKLSQDQLTLTTLLQPDGVTPIQVVVGATSIVPVSLSVSPSAEAAFAAGEILVLVAVHGVLTVSGPLAIAAEVEYVETASR